MKKEALRRICLKASFDVLQNKKVVRFYNVLLKEKEPTGFEPVRRLNTGSADFESAALPLYQLSITFIFYFFQKKSRKNLQSIRKNGCRFVIIEK